MIDLKQRLTLVLVTHNMRQAARCADHVAFMYLGEMREYGTAHQIFTAPLGRELRDYVGGKLGRHPPLPERPEHLHPSPQHRRRPLGQRVQRRDEPAAPVMAAAPAISAARRPSRRSSRLEHLDHHRPGRGGPERHARPVPAIRPTAPYSMA